MTLQAVPNVTTLNPAAANTRTAARETEFHQLRWASRLAHVQAVIEMADEFGEYGLARRLRKFEVRLQRTS